MLNQLRRAAAELLAGYAGAAAGRLPPTAVAAAPAAAVLRLPLALQQCRWAQSGSGGAAESQELQVQPFSVALRQLEAAVTEQVLPPEALAANRQAMAAVMEFARSLESCPTPNGYPASNIKNVTFTFRDPYAGGRLNRVRTQLKTTGGNCTTLVQETFRGLLQRLGLNPAFYFDGEQFRPRPLQPQVVHKPQRKAGASSAPPSTKHVQAVRAQAAAAGFPSQTVSEEQFKEMQQQSEAGRDQKAELEAAMAEHVEAMKKIDRLLEGIAAVPWLHKDGAKDKVQVMKTQVLDYIESLDYDVRGAVRRIWMGERGLALLADGKHPATVDVIKAILFHTRQHEKNRGLALLPRNEILSWEQGKAATQ